MPTILLSPINNSTGGDKPRPYTSLTPAAATETVWAEADAVLSAVKRRLISLPPVQTNDLVIKLGCWNMEYMWQAKAKHFLDTYREIASRHHLFAVQEVTARGLDTIAQTCNYKSIVSHPNSRGQAVGFLVHPRFAVQHVYEYPQLLNVCGVPDLRPALQIDLLDCQTQSILSLVTLHLKSMRGGIPFTSHVRKIQLMKLIGALKNNNNPTIIAGDFNCFLDDDNETNCLVVDGYKLANPHNHSSTQCSGGRLDGLFHKNLPSGLKLSSYNIRNFWHSSLVGRSLSDHGLLTWKLTTK